MYATCLFCNSPLGANEAIEHFPVGRRLAFDAAKGRLWVVCRKCARWNLSPLEERWEAIEEAERAYRNTKKRVATDNIGLARLNDGTDLIRIGEPLRPEFAAWRYGHTFGKRRNKAILTVIGLGVASTIGSQFGAPAMSLAFGGGVLLQAGISLGLGYWNGSRVKVHVTDNEGHIRRLTHAEAWSTRFAVKRSTGEFSLTVSSRHGHVFPSNLSRAYQRVRSLSTLAFDERYAIQISGERAQRALSNLLPIANQWGGDENQVAEAASIVSDRRSLAPMLWRFPNEVPREFWRRGPAPLALNALPPAIRLAMEMSLHEEDERRAMDGELHLLERRWKEAEEIAHIADALTLRAGTEQRLEQLRGHARANPAENVGAQVLTDHSAEPE